MVRSLRRISKSLPLLGLWLAVSPTPAAFAAAAAGSNAAREVEAALKRYAAAVQAGPVDGIVGSYTDDAELLQPGMDALRGRQAIHDFLAPLATQYAVQSAEMTADSTDVHDATAFQWGTYRQTAGPVGGAMGRYDGRFAAEWRREKDGAWRIRRLMVQPVHSNAG